MKHTLSKERLIEIFSTMDSKDLAELYVDLLLQDGVATPDMDSVLRSIELPSIDKATVTNDKIPSSPYRPYKETHWDMNMSCGYPQANEKLMFNKNSK